MSFPSRSKGSVCFSPRGHTLQSHELYQSHSTSLKAAGRGEGKRAESRGREVKATRSGSHLVDSYTHKQMGKTLKGNNRRRAIQLSRFEIMTRTHSEMIETEILIQTNSIPSFGCHIVLESLVRKKPIQYLST